MRAGEEFRMNSRIQEKFVAPQFVPPSRATLLQRKCACGGRGNCEECRKKREVSLQRRAYGAEREEVPPLVYDVLRSPGEALDARTRAFMEPKFGHDFSRVRVH